MRLMGFQIDYDDYDNYLVDRADGEYVRAQMDGHYHQECSHYHDECPTSFFGVNECDHFISEH